MGKIFFCEKSETTADGHPSRRYGNEDEIRKIISMSSYGNEVKKVLQFVHTARIVRTIPR
jgi:hypothetical protein